MAGLRFRLVCSQALLIGGVIPLSATAPFQHDCIGAPVQKKDVQASKSYGSPPIAFINKQIRSQWQDYQISPSPVATDGEWCRRLYLDLIGRIPTVKELQAFQTNRSKDKKKALVRSLLRDSAYREEYAENWTNLWTNILIGRTGGTGRDALASRPGMRAYLNDCFTTNKPYDTMVRELISAKGTSRPGSNGFNGAVNFLCDKLADNAAQATADTSRIFLGLQVQCTQCHNHPFNEWKQRKYWELNAFFRQTVTLRRFVPDTRDVSFVELTNQDYAGEGSPQTPEEAEIYYELRNGLKQVAYPMFVDDAEIQRSGFIDDVDRRSELAELIVDSPYMRDVIVNRTWQHFLGYGFTKPADDMGPHNPPTHPELLAHLGSELERNSFDIKRLIEWIVLSEPYSLSSRTTKDNELDNPLLGESPKFSHFYLRQMRAEELYASLLVATQADQTAQTPEEREKKRSRWLGQFSKAFGTDEGGETTTFNGTIPQALMMFNGDLIREATTTRKGSFLDRVTAADEKSSRKVQQLYLAALSRRPTKKEAQMAGKLYNARIQEAMEAAVKKKKRPADPQTVRVKAEKEALQDIWWALLNSNEFILNH